MELVSECGKEVVSSRAGQRRNWKKLGADTPRGAVGIFESLCDFVSWGEGLESRK